MAPFRILTLVCLVVTLSACVSFESKEVVSLREAQGRATQEQIRQQ